MELHPYTTDLGFADRSARYLAERGCTSRQIRGALIEQLGLTLGAADQIVANLIPVERRGPQR